MLNNMQAVNSNEIVRIKRVENAVISIHLMNCIGIEQTMTRKGDKDANNKKRGAKSCKPSL